MLHHSMNRVVSGTYGGGSIVPTPTWSWNFDGNTTSIPAGNNGVNSGAALANDSNGDPNKAYQFVASENDRMAFDSSNFGADNFSIYLQFIRNGAGDSYQDILSDHDSSTGWTMEMGINQAAGYKFHVFQPTLISTGTFIIASATKISLFVIRSGTDIEVFINDVSVATSTGVGTISDHSRADGMCLSCLPQIPTDHNADITVDGFRIWEGTALSAAEQTAQIAEGI